MMLLLLYRSKLAASQSVKEISDEFVFGCAQVYCFTKLALVIEAVGKTTSQQKHKDKESSS